MSEAHSRSFPGESVREWACRNDDRIGGEGGGGSSYNGSHREKGWDEAKVRSNRKETEGKL